MKKFNVTNLKSCFDFGMSFCEIAEAEKCFIESKETRFDIKVSSGTFAFQSAKINKNGTIVGYFEFKSAF